MTMDKRRIYLEIIFAVLVIFFQHSSAILEYDREDDVSWSRCPTIRHKLRNGRVKIRSRGRIAKFQCDSEYELAGERFATCVRGRWNNPIPHCVSRGCRRPQVPNSRVFEDFRGALLKYVCMPGYSLTVGQVVKNVNQLTVYCDGRKWNPEVPTCEVTNLEPKTSCDFESTDLCGWSQDPSHDFDWRRNQYATPSGHVGTGPTFDHTFGDGRGGVYLYMETSAPRKPNDIARLYSPVYSGEYSGGCFVFWYHMYGQSTGGLRVYMKSKSNYFGLLSPVWELFGDQGNKWIRGNVTVPNLEEGFQIVIEGVRGNGIVGDTAIDDVSLSHENCENIGNSNETESDLDSSCRGRCKDPPKPDVCGCDDVCAYDGNCCDDFQLYCSSSETTEPDIHEEQPGQPSTASTTEAEQQGEISSNITSFATDSSSLPNTTPSSIFKSTAVSPIVTPARIFSSTHSFSTNSSTTSTVSSATVFPIVTSTTTTTTAASTTTTSALTTTTTKPIIKTPEPNTPTMKPTTTTLIPTTTTPAPTSPAPSPATTTPSPTTTTPASTTTTPPPTTTTLPPTTTTPTPITTSTPSTTTSAPIPTIKQSSTIPSTTTVVTVPVQVSTASASTTITDSVFIVTQPPERFTVPPSSTSTRYSPTETFPSTSNVPETRRTYNLRPRVRTVSTTAMTIPWMSRYTTSPYPMTTSAKRIVPATSTTVRYFTTVSPLSITKKVPYTTTSTQRSKFKLTTDDDPAYKDAHASKAASKASDEGHPVVTIVSVTVVVMVGVGAAVVFLLRRWRARKQSKLADDSEMRFLSENEVIEFSDASALDRHNFHQPLI